MTVGLDAGADPDLKAVGPLVEVPAVRGLDGTRS